MAGLATDNSPLTVAVDAVVLDMDGVLTDTARVHRHAWASLFDTYLAERSTVRGEPWEPFTEQDYLEHVDGRPREDGVSTFLAARGIVLDDDAVTALGDRKNDSFLQALADDGVDVFGDAVDLLERLHAAGVATALVTASRNAGPVLDGADLGRWFGAVVDGVVAAQLGLPGKPDPAVFVEAARRVGATPGRTAIVEDAVAGVRAGRAGGFALVVGLDRSDDPGHADRLRAGGADVVLHSLTGLVVGDAPAHPADPRGGPAR